MASLVIAPGIASGARPAHVEVAVAAGSSLPQGSEPIEIVLRSDKPEREALRRQRLPKARSRGPVEGNRDSG